MSFRSDLRAEGIDVPALGDLAWIVIEQVALRRQLREIDTCEGMPLMHDCSQPDSNGTAMHLREEIARYRAMIAKELVEYNG